MSALRKRTGMLVVVAALCAMQSGGAQLREIPAALRRRVLSSLDLDSIPNEQSRWAENIDDLYRAYVKCTPYKQGRACSLTEGKPASTVQVKMIGPDSAWVTVRRYVMSARTCGGGNRPLDPPILRPSNWEALWVARAGDWVKAQLGPGTIC
jgi:hypothetical protein